MGIIPFIDIHTHSERLRPETITVRNIYPGEGFGAFSGSNFYSAGLHPWHIKEQEQNNTMLLMLEEALVFNHIIFIGECGLDKVSKTNFEEQKRVFRIQVLLAEKFQKPLIVHCVKAYNEIVELHRELCPKMPWIFHCYNGSKELTMQLSEKNVYFSFGENIGRLPSKAADSLKMLPLEKIFFETDEFNGNVEKFYQIGAELKNVSLQTLKTEIWNNFRMVEKAFLSHF